MVRVRMEAAASRTAALVAAYRGRATGRPDPVCNDPWAAELAGDAGRSFAAQFDEAFPHGELWVALRTWFLDARVALAMDAGVAQVVILGAGLDTRAARLARPGVRFFEVDHPSSQAHKLAAVAALEGYPRDAASYVGCDFEKEDFLTRLEAGGFRVDAPAVIVWEGVTYYLTEGAVRSTLRRIAEGCHAASLVMFDLVRRRLVTGDVRDPGDRATGQVVAGLGEPLRFGIDDVLPLLAEEGFRFVATASFDELCLARTGTYERRRKFRFQHVAIASRGAPLLT